MNDECLFCRIAAGAADADLVAEGEGWVAVRDIDPQAPAHVLVLPRRHVESLDALEPADRELAGTLLLAAARVAREEGVAQEGYRVVANTNAAGGQTVPHLHLHVLGGRGMRWPPG